LITFWADSENTTKQYVTGLKKRGANNINIGTPRAYIIGKKRGKGNERQKNEPPRANPGKRKPVRVRRPRNASERHDPEDLVSRRGQAREREETWLRRKRERRNEQQITIFNLSCLEAFGAGMV